MALDDGDLMPVAGQIIGGRRADRTGAQNQYLHPSLSRIPPPPQAWHFDRTACVDAGGGRHYDRINLSSPAFLETA